MCNTLSIFNVVSFVLGVFLKKIQLRPSLFIGEEKNLLCANKADNKKDLKKMNNPLTFPLPIGHWGMQKF